MDCGEPAGGGAGTGELGGASSEQLLRSAAAMSVPARLLSERCS
jgi:hypothetical protein